MAKNCTLQGVYGDFKGVEETGQRYSIIGGA